MMERPALGDAAIIAALRRGYGVAVEQLEFTPLGNDSAAWAFRATDTTGNRWFVKLRRTVRPAAVRIPAWLHVNGLPEVVAPIRTLDGEWSLVLDDWVLLVAPFVDGPMAMDVGMDGTGWRRLGSFAARLHAAEVPDELAGLLPREDFRPKQTALARTVDDRVARAGPAELDERARPVVDAWIRHAGLIRHLVDRSEAIGALLRVASDDGARASRAPAFVLCHADLHAGNVLVRPDGGIAVIDWDELILAPKERDLMFVRGSVTAGVVTDDQADAFEAGYGSADVDPLRLAYYRLDWAVQDLADFARRVLLDPEAGPATRDRAVALFLAQFDPGGQVDVALPADSAVAAA